MKWLTSGSHRLKANLSRSFGARKTKKAAAGKKNSVDYKVCFPKSTRLRIIRKVITRSAQSNIYHESNFADNAYAREAVRNRAPHMERRKEESTRICCDDIQLADGSFHSNKMPSAHNQCRREQKERTRDAYTTHQLSGIAPQTGKEQEAQLRDSFTPIIKNTDYQSQPQQQTLRFFNKGFEVDVYGIPLSARLS